MGATWPPIELILRQSQLPESLSQLLTIRYNEHSAEYATTVIDERSELPMNACMFKDNLQDVEEELVDAIFNALVYAYRFPGYGKHAQYLLSSLLIVWSTLSWIREENNGEQNKEIA